MHQQPNALSSSNEARINLAISAIKQDQLPSVRHAAAMYNVPLTTLVNRRAGRPLRRDCEPNRKKLTKLEEEVIVEHILDLDSRGFSPTLGAVRDMADKLLAQRSVNQVDIKWPENFVRRTPSIKPKINRPYDYRRAKCEDPEVIGAWFRRVEAMKAKYGITTHGRLVVLPLADCVSLCQ